MLRAAAAASVENWRAREGCFSFPSRIPARTAQKPKRVNGAHGREEKHRRTEPEGAMAFRARVARNAGAHEREKESERGK